MELEAPKGQGIDPCGIRLLSVQARPLGSLLAGIKRDELLPDKFRRSLNYVFFDE